MMVSLERRSCSPILEISTPSMTIFPPADSRIRNRATVRLDLPAPVRPKIPIWRENGCHSLVGTKYMKITLLIGTIYWLSNIGGGFVLRLDLPAPVRPTMPI